MKQLVIHALLILFAGSTGHAQSLGERMSLHAIANLPISENDNVIPLVGGALGTSFRLNTTGEVISSVSLEIGLLRARVQSSPLDDQQRLTDYDLKLATLGSSFHVAFFLDPLQMFSLGVGAGIEYAFRRFSKGVVETTIFDVKGEEITTYGNMSGWTDPENQLRGVLSIYLKHHFKFGKNQMTLGPFYDYGSVVKGDYDNEVSSSKFGIRMAMKL